MGQAAGTWSWNDVTCRARGIDSYPFLVYSLQQRTLIWQLQVVSPLSAFSRAWSPSPPNSLSETPIRLFSILTPPTSHLLLCQLDGSPPTMRRHCRRTDLAVPSIDVTRLLPQSESAAMRCLISISVGWISIWFRSSWCRSDELSYRWLHDAVTIIAGESEGGDGLDYFCILKEIAGDSPKGCN